MAWTTIANGDLPDADEVMGNFEYLYEYVITDSDTSVADLTTNATSPELKRTFAITGLATTDYIKAVYIQFRNKISNASYYNVITMALDDGTNTYLANIDSIYYVPSFSIYADTTSNKELMRNNATNFSDTYYRGMIYPSGLVTGSTSYNVKVYMYNTTGGLTGTLEKGFTIRVVVGRKFSTSLGSVSDS